MFEKFIELLNEYGDLDEKEISYLRNYTKIRHYKKNEAIHSAGIAVRKIYFVLEGCVRLFYNVDGKNKTAFFYHEGNFIWASNSIKHEAPTQTNYEAIDDSVIVQIDKRILFELIESSANFEMITRFGLEQELIAYQQLIANFIV